MTDLLERDAELATLERLVRDGGIVAIEAGAGIGKTALVDAACSIARREHRTVLRALGADLERDFAFGIVRQLFERACATQPDLLSGAARPAARVVAAYAEQGTLGTDSGFAIVHGLYWLAMNLAERGPMLLAVDDAHWADAASLRWLAYLAARIDSANIAVLVALRPKAPATESSALAAIRAVATRLHPPLLSRIGTERLLQGVLGRSIDPLLVERTFEATGGNPFYLREHVGAIRTSRAAAANDRVEPHAADTIALRIRSRLQALGPGAVRLAQAAAVIGDGAELHRVLAIADAPVEATTRTVADLVRAEILVDDAQLRFIHPIVRDATLQTLATAERDALHRAVARLLYAERAPAGQIAAHLLRVAGIGDGWIVERLRDAAADALARGAPEASVEILERALREPPIAELRVDVLREAARARSLAGHADACAHLETALAFERDSARSARIAAELAQAHATSFRWRAAIAVLDDALARAPKTARGALLGQIAAIGVQHASTMPRALRALDQSLGSSLDAQASFTIEAARAIVAALTAQSTGTSSRLDAALAGALAADIGWDTRAALLWSAITAERFAAAERALALLREEAERTASARGLVAVHSSLALLDFKRGDLASADASARIALTVIDEGDFAPGRPFAATVLAEAAIACGAIDEAQALLDALPRDGLEASVGAALIPAARGRLRLAQGRPTDALAEFETAIALWQPSVWGVALRDAGYLHARSGAALALAARGERDHAIRYADAELIDARAFGGARAIGVAARAAGIARGADGLALLEESVHVLASAPALLEHAATLVEWGAALRRAGQRTHARAALTDGLDAAARCGATPLAVRAREELKIAGARPRRDWSVGIEALTASELRIVRLAYEGQSNRQIAQALYLSIKTVEGHLARAYGKLGITRRSELARALGKQNRG